MTGEGEIFRLAIERDSGTGEGIGFYDGMAVFVPFSVSGDIVLARITRMEQRSARAEVMEIISPSPWRSIPFCPHYEMCGGCAVQHVTYEHNLTIKSLRVADCLERIGGINTSEYTMPTAVGMGKPFHYRNKAVFPIDGGKIGFFRSSSRNICEIRQCALLPAPFIEALHSTRKWLANGGEGACSLLVRTNARGELMAMLSTHKSRIDNVSEWTDLMREECGARCVLLGTKAPTGGEAIGANVQVLFGGKTIDDEILGIKTAISALSFQQVNSIQAGVLYAEVERMIGRSSFVLDAYCGSGTLTQMLARGAQRALGVDINVAAIADAVKSASRNGSDNVSFITGACEQELPRMLSQGDPPDAVVLDPPRRGCDMRVLTALARAFPEKIVYISCDPATLARDARRLGEEGGYAPKEVVVVDMFPWTSHVECVVLMSKVQS